ncbi:hypothetical protein [Sphingorhabdus sp.]|uniref:hypothetical protein n=1 Tax=Sphingorhabdus sp. TaxID=1902408 RepID=UPI00333F729B
MFEWLMLLLAPLVPNATPTETNYIGMVAAETSYSALLSGTTPVKPTPVNPKDCPTCKGTGKVKTGDGISWTKCPTCTPVTQEMQPLPAGTSPKMKLQVQPLPPVKTSSCPDGKCPISRT